MEYDPYDFMLATGRTINLAKPETFVKLTTYDICRSLSQQNRYNGMTSNGTITIAQHSLFCDAIAETMGANPRVRQLTILHDAHEAVTGDIVSPVKRLMGAEFGRLVSQLDHAIFRKYGVAPTHEDNETCALIDQIAFKTEHRVLQLHEDAVNHEYGNLLELVLDQTIQDGGMYLLTKALKNYFPGANHE